MRSGHTQNVAAAASSDLDAAPTRSAKRLLHLGHLVRSEADDGEPLPGAVDQLLEHLRGHTDRHLVTGRARPDDFEGRGGPRPVGGERRGAQGERDGGTSGGRLGSPGLPELGDCALEALTRRERRDLRWALLIRTAEARDASCELSDLWRWQNCCDVQVRESHPRIHHIAHATFRLLPDALPQRWSNGTDHRVCPQARSPWQPHFGWLNCATGSLSNASRPESSAAATIRSRRGHGVTVRLGRITQR